MPVEFPPMGLKQLDLSPLRYLDSLHVQVCNHSFFLFSCWRRLVSKELCPHQGGKQPPLSSAGFEIVTSPALLYPFADKWRAAPPWFSQRDTDPYSVSLFVRRSHEPGSRSPLSLRRTPAIDGAEPGWLTRNRSSVAWTVSAARQICRNVMRSAKIISAPQCGGRRNIHRIGRP